MTEMLVTCFTDIKDSTPLAEGEGLGHERLMPILEEHLKIGKCLIKENDGSYKKNIGDAHMGTFQSLELAIRFATEFQQHVQKRPCLERQNLTVRVALYLGAVEAKNDDVFGSGVNRAARTVGLTEPGTVTINGDLHKNMLIAWGQKKTDKYFKSIGSHDLKGIKDKEELYIFDWQLYAKENADESLASRVYSCLEDASTIPTNFNENDLNSAGFIVWPVVPREIATVIHRGQIEMIRLVALMGWRIHFLIADCGTDGEETSNIGVFKDAILSHATYRNLCGIEDSSLSTYYDKKYDEQAEVIEQFKLITTKLSVKNLTEINLKDYSKDDSSRIQENAALNFLRPILTCATVLHLAKKYSRTYASSKILVVAGEDEKTQWQHVIELDQKHIGALFNPSLRRSDATGQHTARQSRNWPIWLSKVNLFEEMKTTNAAKWVFQLFAQMPSFPSKEASIGGADFAARDWTDEFGWPEKMRINDLIEIVWPKPDTAR